MVDCLVLVVRVRRPTFATATLVGVFLAAPACGDDGHDESEAGTEETESGGVDGDTAGGETGQDTPDAPEAEPMDVPSAPTELQGTTTCVPLLVNETVVSVSPEGHAWLSRPGDVPPRVRVVDPFDATATISAEVELGALLSVRAWTDQDAVVIAADGLWRLEGFSRIKIDEPASLSEASSMCGDPSLNGFLLVDGALFERRMDGQWWVWDSGVGGEAAPDSIVEYDGDCTGANDTLWLTAPDGTLWQLAATETTRPVRFSSLLAMVATAGMLGALETDKLWIGGSSEDDDSTLQWEQWRFPGDVPTQLSASDGALWMLAGSQLLRFDGETWAQVNHDMGSPAIRAVAHPNGAWLISDTEVCNVALGPMIRIEGLRPNYRGAELDYDVRVLSSSGDPVTAVVDGADEPLLLNSETGWYEGTVRLDTLGWHTLVLTAGT
ncbi:MAG: hypothetical protein JKY37_00205, partial [Nannocystaceae bacterium]|nr:hypothetical protein [Nannocystaceae bacterium]